MAKVKPISQQLILQRLRLENPWWDSRDIPAIYKELKRRPYFELFYHQVQAPVRRANVLMGPRRVGKTVMLYQLVQELMNKGVASKKICFISVDAPIYNNMGLEELFGLCRKALNDETTKGYYIIFDEIQYLKNWENHLKTIVDLYTDTKFVVSGSAAAALKIKSNESGAGRFSDFMLPPLTFQEYLYLKDLDYLMREKSINWDGQTRLFYLPEDYKTLNDHFINYINFGGYPEVLLNEEIQKDPGRFIRSDIIDKVLLRDLPSLFGIRDVSELNSLFNVIAYNSGNEFNMEGLAQESGVAKETIRKYLTYLEAAFLIKILYPVGINTKRFQRASRFKIYLTNPSMRCALFTPISESDEQFGEMVETAIIAQWLHTNASSLHYAAWQGGEVDLVMVGRTQKPKWTMEIKWSNQYFHHPGKLKSLLKYTLENKLERAWSTTIDQLGRKEIHGKILYFFPAAASAYLIGKSIITEKQTLSFWEIMEAK